MTVPNSNAPARFAHEAMHTTFEAIVPGRTARYAGQFARAVFDEIDRLERLLSRHIASSDIGQVNRLRPGGFVAVDRDVFECLYIARQVHADTGGLFDVTVGPLIDYWKQIRAEQRPPDPTELAARRAAVGMDRLVFQIEPATGDPDGPRRFLVGLRPDAGPDAGTGAAPIRIDLGGIGKGFALDKAAALMGDWDIASALLSAGGSTVLALGPGRPDEGDDGWRLGIGGPWADDPDRGVVRLRDLALSGSGPELQGEHIFHPLTGAPARLAVGAWSLGPSAAVCDALSTAFLMMTAGEVEAFCSVRPDYCAYLVRQTAPDAAPAIQTHGPIFADRPPGAIHLSERKSGDRHGREGSEGRGRRR